MHRHTKIFFSFHNIAVTQHKNIFMADFSTLHDNHENRLLSNDWHTTNCLQAKFLRWPDKDAQCWTNVQKLFQIQLSSALTKWLSLHLCCQGMIYVCVLWNPALVIIFMPHCNCITRQVIETELFKHSKDAASLLVCIKKFGKLWISFFLWVTYVG